ncbi:hypothetical protein WUBG_16800, partial [Wuchereria bancrofti]
ISEKEKKRRKNESQQDRDLMTMYATTVASTNDFITVTDSFTEYSDMTATP